MPVSHSFFPNRSKSQLPNSFSPGAQSVFWAHADENCKAKN